MSNPNDVGNRCTIVVADLFAMINARRKLFRLPPIESRAMAARCTLRFNIDKKRGVDFGTNEIVVASADLAVLEKVVNDQFSVRFDGELSTLCAKAKKPVEEPVEPVLSSEEEDMPAELIEPERPGLLSKIKRLFGGK